ncbi:hypothetical protein, partial [Enterobacter asburiae]
AASSATSGFSSRRSVVSVGIVMRGSPYLGVMLLFAFWYFYLYHIQLRRAGFIPYQKWASFL